MGANVVYGNGPSRHLARVPSAVADAVAAGTVEINGAIFKSVRSRKAKDEEPEAEPEPETAD